MARVGVLLLVGAIGCAPGGGGPRPSSSCACGPDACASERCADDAGVGPAEDGGDIVESADVVAVRLEPGSAELVSADGAQPTQAFQTIAILDDGTERPARGPRFGVTDRSVGEVDGGGTFTANGLIGGTTEVTAELAREDGTPLAATAAVTVLLEHRVVSGEVPADG